MLRLTAGVHAGSLRNRAGVVDSPVASTWTVLSQAGETVFAAALTALAARPRQDNLTTKWRRISMEAKRSQFHLQVCTTQSGRLTTSPSINVKHGNLPSRGKCDARERWAL